jgi:hypothetical protein
VPIPDDERFEAYLKQFRPLVPRPLAAFGSRHRVRGRFVLRTGAAAAVAILAGAAALHIHTQRVHFAGTTSFPAIPDRLPDGEPLTMRSANVLMMKAPSFQALIDDIAFRSQAIPLPKGKLSTVAVLGKEKTKL